MTNQRLDIVRSAPRLEFGGCSFCTNRPENVTVVQGQHPMRHVSVRLCAECLAELKATLQDEPSADPPITPPVDADPIKNAKLKMHAYHMGKGPMPSWMDLYQGFVAAHDKIVEFSENRLEPQATRCNCGAIARLTAPTGRKVCEHCYVNPESVINEPAGVVIKNCTFEIAPRCAHKPLDMHMDWLRNAGAISGTFTCQDCGATVVLHPVPAPPVNRGGEP